MYGEITPKKRRKGVLGSVLLAALLLAAAVVLVLAEPSRAATTMNVNSNADATDANPGDGRCVAADGKCTLRAAIQEANALSGTDTVNVPAGTYELAIEPVNENGIESGDLDITGPLNITGVSSTYTIIDGGQPKAGSPTDVRGMDRLFEVHPSADKVNISRVKLRDGYAAEYGGAIFNAGDADVTVYRTGIVGSSAGKNGGAIENHASGTVNVNYSETLRGSATEGGILNNNSAGTLSVASSTISGGTGDAAAGDGGTAVLNSGEANAEGTIKVTDSTITGNTGKQPGGAISNEGAGSVTVEHSTITDNKTTADGGGINNGDFGTVTVKDSAFSGNEADNGGAINSSGKLTVVNSDFGSAEAGNRAHAGGGAINNTGDVDATDSTFTKNTAADWGGGILNGGKGNVSVKHGTFTDNFALDGGGFASDGDGQVSVENSDFLRNKAPQGYGGGLHNANSKGEFTLTGSTFSGNEAENGAGFSNEGKGAATVESTQFSENTAQGEGGGIIIDSGAVKLRDVEVLNNSAVVGGGGISYQGDAAVSVGESAAIEDATISGNTTPGVGGGIDSRGDGILSITTSTFFSNTAGQTGGGINHEGDAALDVTRSTLYKNKAEPPATQPGGEPGGELPEPSSGEAGSGGGIFTDGDGEATLENTTLSHNTAASFGGGLLAASRATLSHTTIASNSASSGGGINNGGGDLVGDGLVYLRNTLVAHNVSGGNCAGAMTSEGGNLLTDSTCALQGSGDGIDAHPRMSPLRDNGGPTLTHALYSASPAKDNATETLPADAQPPETDQRGIPRPQGDGLDVGAFELKTAGSQQSQGYPNALR